MIGFGGVSSQPEETKILFIAHSTVVGIALAVLLNADQVAISVASQRYGLARTQVKDKGEHLGRILS